MACWRSTPCMLLLAAIYSPATGFLGRNADPAMYYSTPELIRAAGYPAQQYNVTTEDGYILGLFRIADNPGTTSNRPPVLLMHGFTSASDMWLMQGRKKDLAYMLYNAGYDVWLGDVRGNVYSRRHVSLSPSNPLFWQFSFHEMGSQDVPTFVDFIIRTTGYQQISYVGHSMGTTNFFVMASERPNYMRKIRIFVAMSPVAAMDPNIMAPEKKTVIDFIDKLANSLKKQGTNDLLPRVRFAPPIAKLFCHEGSFTQDLCYDTLFFWAGSQAKRISRKSLALILSHTPAGLSLNTPLHFLQVFKGRFQQMDYGQENFRRYGGPLPPEYKLSRVTCPTAVYYSLGDYITNATDVLNNIAVIPNIVELREYKDLNHIDFIWGRSAWREVYLNVVKIIDLYNNKAK